MGSSVYTPFTQIFHIKSCTGEKKNLRNLMHDKNNSYAQVKINNSQD